MKKHLKTGLLFPDIDGTLNNKLEGFLKEIMKQ